jgi:hypothetical protein
MVREPLPVRTSVGHVSRVAVFNVYNFVAYQVAWFAVIIGAAEGYAWAGAAVALLVAAVHVWLRRDPHELKLIGLAAVIGILVDSTLAMTGQVRFAAAWPIDLAPYWMVSLWIAFATTLHHSLRWLMYRPVAAALSGALGGPLAYLAGAKLGALSLATPAITLPLIAMLWVLAMVTFSMIVMRAASVPEAGRMPA